MIAQDTLPLVAVGAISLGLLAKRRLTHATQPLRLRLAERGETMLARSDLPSEMRLTLEMMLDTAFGMMPTLALSLLAIPLFAIGMVFSRRIRAAFLRDDDCPAHLRGEYAELLGLHQRVTFINHPLLVPLMLVWLTLWFMPVIVAASLILNRPPKQIDQGAVLAAIEAHRLPNFMPAMA